MSALAHSDSTRARRPVVLLGSPRPSSAFVAESSDRRVVVGAQGEGNWQDLQTRLAAACGGGRFQPCGCSQNSSCSCKGKDAANGNGNGTSNANAPLPAGHPGWLLMGGKVSMEECRRARWVPVTVANAAIVPALGTGTATFRPEASFRLARMTISAAQSTDFVINSIAVGPTQNVMPGDTDGTYFSVASNQDGDGRIDAPIADPGQSVKVNFTSTAGVGLGVGRFTLQGSYAGQLDAHY